MESGKKGAVAKEIIGFGILAVVFFQLNFFLLIFVIPLVVVYRRRGFLPGAAASLIAFGGIIGAKLYQLSRIADAFSRLDLFALDLVIPGSFILGLLAVEAPAFKGRRLFARLLLATAAAIIVSLPLVVFVAVNPEFDAILRYQIQVVIKTLQAGEPIGPAGEGPKAILEQVTRLSKQVFLYTYAAGYLLTLGVNYMVGDRFARKLKGVEEQGGEKSFSFAAFKLPDGLVWWFLVSWAGVFFGMVSDIGFAKIALWNSALTATVMYGCQGIGILKTWTDKMGKGTKMLFTFSVVFSVFIPGLNVILAAGVPLLGVTELWIQYRSKERS